MGFVWGSYPKSHNVFAFRMSCECPECARVSAFVLLVFVSVGDVDSRNTRGGAAARAPPHQVRQLSPLSGTCAPPVRLAPATHSNTSPFTQDRTRHVGRYARTHAHVLTRAHATTQTRHHPSSSLIILGHSNTNNNNIKPYSYMYTTVPVKQITAWRAADLSACASADACSCGRAVNAETRFGSCSWLEGRGCPAAPCRTSDQFRAAPSQPRPPCRTMWRSATSAAVRLASAP